jgi:hypothetical protein
VPRWAIVLGVTAGVLVQAAVAVWVATMLAADFAPRPVVDADLATLLSEWRRNPVATAQKYRGHDIRITGYVARFARGWNPYIDVSATEHPGLLTATAKVNFEDPALTAQLRDYPRGSRIGLVVRLGRADSFLECTAVAIGAREQRDAAERQKKLALASLDPPTPAELTANQLSFGAEHEGHTREVFV